MTNKEKYKKLCLSKEIPLFSQYYWMEAVSDTANWDVIIIEENGTTLATLVYYYLINQDGEIDIHKAPLTQNNGIIYFYPPKIKYERKLSFEFKVANRVIDELERLNISKFRQYFHHSFNNWLPFFHRGYNQTTRYTYIIEDSSNLEKIFLDFSTDVRNKIKNAQKQFVVKTEMSSSDFYNFNQMVFFRQGLEPTYSLELFKKLFATLDSLGNVKIFYAVDNYSTIHSAALFVHDTTTLYYLMSGSIPELMKYQSITLLVYEGIKYANALGKKFDFEGSMKKNIEVHFRKFGGRLVPYYDITKDY